MYSPLVFCTITWKSAEVQARGLWYTKCMIVTVDTGGTKTLIASFDHRGEVLQSIKFATPKDVDEYVYTLRLALQKNFEPKDVEVLIIALPGIIKDGVALWCNNLRWKDFEAHSAFQSVFGKKPVFIENDANLAGLAEARALDPVPTSVLYVTISTGIGTGIITNGSIDPGLRLSEGGRTMVEFDGVIREWESFASGKAIHATYGKYAREITSKRSWLQIANRISRGFLALIPVLQPEVIVIGGSIGVYFSKFAPQLEAILREKLPPHIACPHFTQASHPEEAVIYGGYYYAIDTLATR
jgi:predicted NBD/HSP70 family sugar kinase